MMDALVDNGISGSGNYEFHVNGLQGFRTKQALDVHADEQPPSSSSGNAPATKSWWETTNWFRVKAHSEDDLRASESKEAPLQPLDATIKPVQSTATATQSYTDSAPTSAAAIRSIQRGDHDRTPHNQLRTELEKIVDSSDSSTAAVEWHPSAQPMDQSSVASNGAAEYIPHKFRHVNMAERNNIARSMLEQRSTDSAHNAGTAGLVMNRFTTSSSHTKRMKLRQKTANKQLRQLRNLVQQLTDLHTARQIEEYILLPLYQSHLFTAIGSNAFSGVLITGGAGAGKTYLIDKLIENSNVYHSALNSSNLLSDMEAEAMTATPREKQEKVDTHNLIHRVFSQALKNAPAIITIDNIDLIASAPQAGESSTLTKVRGILRTEIDRVVTLSNKSHKPIVIVGITTSAELIDNSLRRIGRLHREVDIQRPNEDTRYRLLQQITASVKIHPDVDLRQVAAECLGFNAAELTNLVSEAGLICVREQINQEMDEDDDTSKAANAKPATPTSTEIIIQPHHIQSALLHCRSQRRGDTSQIPNLTFQDVGGELQLKQTLTETVQWPMKFQHLYQTVGLNSSSGVLLYGPPGCGKSLIAQSVAGECKTNFIHVKGPELLSAYMGESEAAVRSLFARARNASPCIIFLDEIDSIALRRGNSNRTSDSTSDRILTQLLTEFDNQAFIHSDKPADSKSAPTKPPTSVFVIAATNRPEVIDPAMLRAGRLDELIYVGLPDVDGRYEIMRNALRNTPLNQHVVAESSQYLHQLAKRTSGFSSADVTHLCKIAIKLLIHQYMQEQEKSSEMQIDRTSLPGNELAIEHLERALLLSRPSVSPRELIKYAAFAQYLADTAGTATAQKQINDLPSGWKERAKAERAELQAAQPSAANGLSSITAPPSTATMASSSSSASEPASSSSSTSAARESPVVPADALYGIINAYRRFQHSQQSAAPASRSSTSAAVADR